jgi:hypothetical protein
MMMMMLDGWMDYVCAAASAFACLRVSSTRSKSFYIEGKRQKKNLVPLAPLSPPSASPGRPQPARYWLCVGPPSDT